MKKIILLANISIEVILKMAFFIFLNANILLTNKKITWKIYIMIKILFTIKKNKAY